MQLTSGFRMKLENHLHMLALYFTHYNFVCIHNMLKITRAMAAGVLSQLRGMERIGDLIDVTHKGSETEPPEDLLQKNRFQTEILPNIHS